jgi:hypothetical protein
LLEFKLPEPDVRVRVRKWYGDRWFAPNALKGKALTDTVRGLYIPYWTFDAQVHADWTAESGYHYYVTESYTDSDGKSQTRQVQKTRWVPSSGSLDHFFDDELVPASRGVDEKLLRKIEPFLTTPDLKPYDPGFLFRVDGRAIPDRPGRGRAKFARDPGAEDARSLRERSAGRYPLQSQCRLHFFGPDLQTHSRSDLARGVSCVA